MDSCVTILVRTIPQSIYDARLTNFQCCCNPWFLPESRLSAVSLHSLKEIKDPCYLAFPPQIQNRDHVTLSMTSMLPCNLWDILARHAQCFVILTLKFGGKGRQCSDFLLHELSFLLLITIAYQACETWKRAGGQSDTLPPSQ